jgi:Ca2+-binding EF-hand superfamily protein
MQQLRMSIEKQAELSACFDAFNETGQGLRLEDLKCAATAILGFKPSKRDLINWLVGTDAEHTQILSKGSFMQLMASKLALVDEREELRSMFKAFDVRHQGFLTVDSLIEVMKEACPAVTAGRVADMFAEADVDGSGRIGYMQFEQIVLGRRSRLDNVYSSRLT